MLNVHKHIVTDEQSRPVAVQIPYEDWLEIERRLEQLESARAPRDLMRHAGRLRLKVDPLEIQRLSRDEWP